MIFSALKKSFFSIQTLFAVSFILIMGFGSYFFSLVNKRNLTVQLSSGAKDLNANVVERMLYEYNGGLRFFYNFISSNDFFFFVVLVLLIWIGIFLSAEMLSDKNSGFGNFYMVRQKYSKSFGKFCFIGMMQITSVMFFSMFLLFVFSFIWGGWSATGLQNGESNLSFFSGVLFCWLQICFVTLYCILIFLISASLAMFINNIYITRIFPVLVFIIIPQVLGSTLANVFPVQGRYLIQFIPMQVIASLTGVLTLNAQLHPSVYLHAVLSVGILVVVFAFLGLYNIRTFSRDYL